MCHRSSGRYKDIAGFCKSTKLEEIQKHGYILTPGRYVGTEAQEEDDETFKEKMKKLTTEFKDQFAQSAKLEIDIKKNLENIEFKL